MKEDQPAATGEDGVEIDQQQALSWLTGAGTPLFEPPLFQPRYTPMQAQDWQLRLVPLIIVRGYWGTTAVATDMAVLTRRRPDGGHDTWMSMSPMELESQEVGCLEARGHTVVMGLGLGWAAAAAAMNPAVTAVTVVEMDRAVLDLHQRLCLFEQLPAAARDKLRVVEGDALEWTPDRPVDFLMPDIWLPLYSGPGRVEEVRRMQANTRAPLIYFWGQELVLAALARDRLGVPVQALDAGTLRRAAALTGLPLAGLDRPDYADKLRTAALRRLPAEPST